MNDFDNTQTPQTQSQADQLPWYKQFWPWFIIMLPTTVVIAGITTVVIAYQQADNPVSDNYYKEGLAINQVMDAMDSARENNIRAEMSIDESLFQVVLHSDKPMPTDNLVLDLRHPLDASKDQQVRLIYAGNNTYRGALPYELKQGKWYLDIYPQGDNPSWLLKGEANLPNTEVKVSAN